MSENNDSVHDVSVTLALQDFLASTEVQRLSPRTQEEYRINLACFARWCSNHSMKQDNTRQWKAIPVHKDIFQEIYLHQVNRQVVECFLRHIKATHKPSKAGQKKLSLHTIAQYVKDIKRFLNWCIEESIYQKGMDVVEVRKIKKPIPQHNIIEIFSIDDIHALFQACQKERYESLRIRDRAIVALLLDTGVRAMELCTLTIGDTCLDVKNPYIRVLGKGQKVGQIGFGQKSRQYLQEYLKLVRIPMLEEEVFYQYKDVSDAQKKKIVKQHMEYAYFFVNRASEPLSRNGLYQLVDRLGEWADVKGVRCSPHTFRHTFSCLFMRNNGDIYTLSNLLRHSSVKVTEEYLKCLKQAEARLRAKSVLDYLQE